MKKNSIRLTMMALLFVVMLAACHKKPPPAPPAPPTPPPQPSAELSVNPTTINPGQSATLSWNTTNATSVTIDPIGKVDLSGQRTVNPTESTTYHLTAGGPGGTAEQTARITVSQPQAPPRTETPAAPNLTLQQQWQQQVGDKGDVFFDYDSFSVRPDAQNAIQLDAQFLKAHPDAKITIEGHCDERGSTEYNLTLGDNRARSVRDALVQAGVPAGQLTTISYGKEKPFCTESNEQCWQQNRRAHFVYGQR